MIPLEPPQVIFDHDLTLWNTSKLALILPVYTCIVANDKIFDHFLSRNSDPTTPAV